MCSDSDGTEKIAIGRGLAFQQKAGMDLNDLRIEKLFVLKNEETNNKFKKFIENIPLEQILLAEKIISHAKQVSSKNLDDSIYITLTDHLNAALDRARKNIAVTNPLTSAIKSFYPDEFSLGLDASKIVKEETGISFSLDEIAFITMHFVTAELGESTPEFNSILLFVQRVSEIAQKYVKTNIDETSNSWQRFLTHLSFFAQRIMTHKERPDKNAIIYEAVAKSFPDAYKAMCAIVEFVESEYAYTVPDDEKTYLMIHMNRLQIEFGSVYS